MSAYQFSFPASRTCLWDSSPLGNAVELSITKRGWVLVQVSSSCLQLAFNHAKNSASKSIDCFLIARSWINEGETITLEVDRFDPGRLNKERTAMAPTSLIVGDIAVKAQIVIGSHPDVNYLTHNLISLQETLEEMKQSLSIHHTNAPDPAHFLSLRIHCSCSHDGSVSVRCGCVVPSLMYQATPINPIPIVMTALALNLSGPLPLSALQKRIKHGYITMETSRKLVLLIHSDPLVRSLPIIGVWVSGVGSVHHPMVWSACMAYAKSSALSDQVCGQGGTFVALVYCEGCTQPSFWECQATPPPEGNHGKGVPVQMHTGEAVLQVPSEHQLVGVALHPAQESTALHTLLETALRSSPDSTHLLLGPVGDGNDAPPSTPPQGSPISGRADISTDSPLPSPPLFTPSQAPQRLARDKNLSVISSPSILESVQQSSGDGGSQGYTQLTQLSSLAPPPPSPPHSTLPLEAEEKVATSSSSDTPLCSGNGHAQQTTPTSHMGTPSIHMTLEDHQRQLQTLQDEIKQLLQAQSPSSALTTPPAASTSDAGTNTGASLCWPPETPHPSSGSQQWDEDSEPRVAEHFSVRTATTSMMSHGTDGNMQLDFPSFASSSNAPHSQAFPESPSMTTLPVDWTEQECGQLSPTSVLSLRHHSTEDILAEALEKVRILEQLQTRRHSSTSAHTLPAKTAGSGGGFSCSSSSCSSRGSGDCCGHVSTQNQTLTNRSNLWRKNKGSGGGSGGDEDEYEEDDPTPLPLPPHSRNSPLRATTPPFHNPPLPQQPNYDQSNYPYVTPLSAKNNNHYLLHPDVMHQHFSPEISMLPVPHILCANHNAGGGGSGGDPLPLAAMLGDDCTVDEKAFLADMIALKYLGLSGGSSRTHAGSIEQTEARQLGYGTNGAMTEYTVIDRTLSVASRQYLQRHNLMAPSMRGGVAAPLVEDEQGQNETLDIQALKTLPKLT